MYDAPRRRVSPNVTLKEKCCISFVVSILLCYQSGAPASTRTFTIKVVVHVQFFVSEHMN